MGCVTAVRYSHPKHPSTPTTAGLDGHVTWPSPCTIASSSPPHHVSGNSVSGDHFAKGAENLQY